MRPPGTPPVRSAAIETPRILLVCTGNQCRSPMAAGLLGDLLARRGISAEVASAGLLAGGRPATPTGVEVLLDRGIDAGRHVSRHLAEPEVALLGTDLVLGMERRHVQEAVLLEPDVRTRAFTLVDAVRRAEAAPPRQPGERFRDWAARLSIGRTNADLIGVGDDAVDDPVGRPRAVYEETADLLADLLGRLVDRAFPADHAREQREARSA